MPSSKNKSAAVSRLLNALSMAEPVDPMRGVSSAVLGQIRSAVTDALELLQEHDPVKRQAGMIALAIKQSTELCKVFVGVEEVDHWRVTDRELFNWAVKHSHKVPGAES